MIQFISKPVLSVKPSFALLYRFFSSPSSSASVGPAVGSSLLYEDARLCCNISPSHTHTHANAHTQEAILIQYSFTILSLRLLFPSSSIYEGGGGGRVTIETNCVAVIVVVHFMFSESSARLFSWILW